ncbi:MAG: hypothetical protein VX768_12995 [Planctomycetota bacterium]|nr:hypothetical protein [Planctomycetota bacterium]
MEKSIILPVSGDRKEHFSCDAAFVELLTDCPGLHSKPGAAKVYTMVVPDETEKAHARIIP